MRINDNYVLNKVLDNYIIIDVSSNNKTIYKLNKTSLLVFESIKDGNSLEEIVKKMIDQYDIDENIAKNDIEELINELKKLSIVIDD